MYKYDKAQYDKETKTFKAFFKYAGGGGNGEWWAVDGNSVNWRYRNLLVEAAPASVDVLVGARTAGARAPREMQTEHKVPWELYSVDHCIRGAMLALFMGTYREVDIPTLLAEAKAEPWAQHQVRSLNRVC
jgi:hypothetical protein